MGIAKEYFGTKDVRDLRKLDIVNYQDYIIENYNFSNKALKNCLDIFKTFPRYAKEDLELLTVVSHFPVIEVPQVITTWLTPEKQKVDIFNLSLNEKVTKLTKNKNVGNSPSGK